MNFQVMTDDQLWDFLESLKDDNGAIQDPMGQGHLAHAELMRRPNSFHIHLEHSDADIAQALLTLEGQMQGKPFVA